ncbi:MAG: hypothetical protein NTV34_03480 [Proteobacteria bacterium]|nr:hypothetical protein [Pseudomonadota bacterium]
MRNQKLNSCAMYASLILILSSCGLGGGSGGSKDSRTKPQNTDSSASGSTQGGTNTSGSPTSGGTTKTENGVGGGGTTNVADPNFQTNFNSQPSSFYIMGQQITQVTTSLDAINGSKCSKAEIGNFKAFKSSSAARLAVCIPIYSSGIGGDSITSNHMLSLDNPIWSNPNL